MEQPAVGANRWINSKGIVLEAIDPVASTGMVRILGEEWRATSDRSDPGRRPGDRQGGARGPVGGRAQWNEQQPDRI